MSVSVRKRQKYSQKPISDNMVDKHNKDSREKVIHDYSLAKYLKKANLPEKKTGIGLKRYIKALRNTHLSLWLCWLTYIIMPRPIYFRHITVAETNLRLFIRMF